MTFRVKAGNRLHYGDGTKTMTAPDGKKIAASRFYEEGDLVELTSKEAAAMPWAVEPADEPETKKK